MSRHVVMFSGGIASWAAANRVAQEHGTDDLVLLFTDTLIEDEDVYRFLDEASAQVGGELVRLSDGRNPWEVFHDVRFLGNSRADPCSRILKRELSKKWINENCDPDDSVLYVGIDWTEEHRLGPIQRNWKPYQMVAPLCSPPYLTRAQIIDLARNEGIEPPRQYAIGFAHANCGGFCIKSGLASFKLLLEAFPKRYRWHEEQEQKLQEYLGKPVTIMRDRSGGTTTPISMKQFRERIEAEGTNLFDTFELEHDIGGCGCFTSFPEEEEQVGDCGPEDQRAADVIQAFDNIKKQTVGSDGEES